MRIFFDTEFIEDGHTIDLISIGMVAEDGHEFYAEVHQVEVPWFRANDWVLENVKPHLLGAPYWNSLAGISGEIAQWVGQWDEPPEFWAYYADYDWVVLCQLYGRMIDLPEGWPMYCRDLIQSWSTRFTEHPKECVPMLGTEHNALDDARWNKRLYDYIAARTA